MVFILVLSLPALAVTAFLIDPGHGGEDGGAAAGGVTEKDVNLDIGLKVGAMLELFGVPVTYTRTEDISLHAPEAATIAARKSSDLKIRLKMANALNNGAYVSIHQNTYPSPKEWGAQIFYSPNHPLSEVLGRSVKDSINSNVARNSTNRRGIKKARDLYIMDNLEIPGVIVECGFLTHPEEVKLLCQNDYQNEMAAAIMAACLLFASEDIR